MTRDEFVSRALTVPFVDRGRDWSGWDCYGLLVVHRREIFGVELPLFDAGYETAGNTRADREAIAALEPAARAAWRPVDRPEVDDILVLRCWGRPIHVGVMVGPDRFLHAERAIGTVVERLASPVWAKRIEGAYRYAPNNSR